MIYFETFSVPTADILFLLILSILTLESAHSIRFLYQHLSVSKKSGGFGKYRDGGTFGSRAFYGKIRECPGSVILFQALLLDDVKFEDGKMYAELCTIFSFHKVPQRKEG